MVFLVVTKTTRRGGTARGRGERRGGGEGGSWCRSLSDLLIDVFPGSRTLDTSCSHFFVCAANLSTNKTSHHLRRRRTTAYEEEGPSSTKKKEHQRRNVICEEKETSSGLSSKILRATEISRRQSSEIDHTKEALVSHNSLRHGLLSYVAHRRKQPMPSGLPSLNSPCNVSPPAPDRKPTPCIFPR